LQHNGAGMPHDQDGLLKTGERVSIRPIRPDDEALLVRFHEGLSDQTVYFRYFHMMKLRQRISQARLRKVCRPDPAHELALVAIGTNPTDLTAELMGVARLHKAPGSTVGEFSIVVADRFQGIGLGGALMQRLIRVARADGLTRLQADVLSANANMKKMCQRVGIPVLPTDDPQLFRADYAL
jgi:acetyltransferase